MERKVAKVGCQWWHREKGRKHGRRWLLPMEFSDERWPGRTLGKGGDARGASFSGERN
jgi:hypothetical protein